MSITHDRLARLRRNLLAACLATSFASSGFDSGLAAAAQSSEPLPTHPPDAAADIPPPTTIFVYSCDDDGIGSLRRNAGLAASGDTLDLSKLPCSTITLTSGEIVIAQDILKIKQRDGQPPVTITAGNTSRVFNQTTSGFLGLYNLNIRDGVRKYTGSGTPYGGCISSNGSVGLYGVTLSNCKVIAGNPDIASIKAKGGAVYAHRLLSVSDSRISDNSVYIGSGNQTPISIGGGLYAGDGLLITRSTISGNSANAIDGDARGGGAAAKGMLYMEWSTVSGNSSGGRGGGLDASVNFLNPNQPVHIENSTISGNTSRSAGGLWLQSQRVHIRDSTISSNRSDQLGGGLYATLCPVEIFNSTIAGNVSGANGADNAGGAVFNQLPAHGLQLQSSLIANNTFGDGTESDLGSVGQQAISIEGGSSLVRAIPPYMPAVSFVISGVDPQLGPLADNGGPTKTHALLPGSPAIDHGSNNLGLSSDQRGVSRMLGATTDIGAFELVDVIFANGFESR